MNGEKTFKDLHNTIKRWKKWALAKSLEMRVINRWKSVKFAENSTYDHEAMLDWKVQLRMLENWNCISLVQGCLNPIDCITGWWYN